MIIQLADNWRVVTDNLNFELQEKTEIKSGDNKGQEKWTRRGYYSGLDSVLRAIPDHLALCETITTYEEYLASWSDLRKQIATRMTK